MIKASPRSAVAAEPAPDAAPIGIDLSKSVFVTQLAKIDLAAIDTSKLEPEQKKFAEWLQASKQVIYDWGRAVYHVSDIPFVIDREAKTITPNPVNEHWAAISQDDLRSLAGKAWTGEWSPTAADSLLTLMNSGVKVEIVNHEKYGPSDPVQFIKDLRLEFGLAE